jgi:hypothetical protein
MQGRVTANSDLYIEVYINRAVMHFHLYDRLICMFSKVYNQDIQVQLVSVK